MKCLIICYFIDHCEFLKKKNLLIVFWQTFFVKTRTLYHQKTSVLYAFRNSQKTRDSNHASFKKMHLKLHSAPAGWEGPSTASHYRITRRWPQAKDRKYPSVEEDYSSSADCCWAKWMSRDGIFWLKQPNKPRQNHNKFSFL